MNMWDAFTASPLGFIAWTLAVGFSVGLGCRGLAVLVTAARGR